MKKDEWLPQMMGLEVEDLGSTSDRLPQVCNQVKEPKTSQPNKQTKKTPNMCIAIKTKTIPSVTLSCPMQRSLSSEAKNPDLSVSVIEVRLAPLCMGKAPVRVYHSMRPVSTGRKLLNKASHVQSASTIAISCHKSSESMVLTCLPQILWRTEVYHQSRQDV